MDLKNKYFGKTKEEAAKKKIDIKKENKQIFDAVKQFERNEIATVQGKAKFITRIAVVLLISNIALAAAIAFLSPLKTAVPFVIRVDNWICPYISRHLLSLNPLLACCRRYSRGER